MAGNSQRRGAIRKGASKKGATVGSGGQRRRGLEGKGPTPPAEARKGHVKNRVANAKAKRSASSPAGRRPVKGRGGKGTSEIAAEHFVGEATVRTQVQSILRRLEVNSRLAAVALAREVGWNA